MGTFCFLAQQEYNDADMPDQVDGNGVGGIAENWSDQQTIKVKVSRYKVSSRSWNFLVCTREVHC